MTEFKLRVGTRVEVVGKDTIGTVAFIGATQFSSGKWIGVVLDEPKGKNNGTVQGKRYFTCDEDHGIFVRPTQLKLLDGEDDSNLMSTSVMSESSVASETGSATSGSKLKKPTRSDSASSLKQPSPTKGLSPKPSPLTQESKSLRQSVSSRPRGDGAGSSMTASLEKIPIAQPKDMKMSLTSSGSSPAIGTEDRRRSSGIARPVAVSTSSTPTKQSPGAVASTTGLRKPDSPVTTPTSTTNVSQTSTTSKSNMSVQPTVKKNPPSSPIVEKPTKVISPTPVAPTPKIDTSPAPASPAVVTDIRRVSGAGDGTHSPDTELEITNLRAEIKTLTDQLEALKVKREEDRTRLQELERLKIQLTQLEENRRLMREQAADLQRSLAQAKTEKAEVQEAFDRYREETADMVENMEMATLDKEMAEEKLDSVTHELELLKEQVEELTLENQILKEESEEKAGPSPDGAPSQQQLKNLEQQNERMKQVLVKLRDLANQDKQDISRLNKEITTLESEVGQLKTEKERLAEQLNQSVEQMIELKEQVDASLGADQMVSQLTQRNLELEEQLEKLTEERNDLEALCEMNDELQENSRDTERELREEIEQGRTQISQLVRHMDACRETIADYEKTLSKFRDLVTDLQAQNSELRRSLADGKRQHEVQLQQQVIPHATEALTGTPPNAGFGLVSQAQTMAKMIEGDLRRLEAEQSNAHVARLTAFLPDSFLRRGGDYDALLTVLLIDRMAAKTDLLATHITERYPLPSCIPGQTKPPSGIGLSETIPTDQQNLSSNINEIRLPGSTTPLPPMTKSRSEFYSFITCLVFLLRCWSALLIQYKQILSGCGVDLFLKLGSLYTEMASHEHSIDSLLELTRKDQLDENTSLESLIGSITYFVQLRSVHLVNEPLLDCSTKLGNFVRCVLTAADALATDATALMILTGQQLTPLEEAASDAAASVGGPVGLGITIGDEPVHSSPASTGSPGGLLSLLKEVIRFSTIMRITARRIRRRLPKDNATQPLSFNPDVAASLDKAVSLLNDVVSTLRETTRKTGKLTAHQEDSDLKPKVVFSECLVEAYKEIFTKNGNKATGLSPDVCLRACLSQARELITKITVAMDNGEYDFDGTKQPKLQEPCTLRAIAYKQSQAELEASRAKVEAKEEEVRELQMSLKARASELSEMSVRVGLAEKRLENAGKGNEEKISRLEQKLEQMDAQQKRNDREHEQTVDALQADIEALEQEKAELKEKLKSLSKKVLFDGLIRSPIATSSSPTRQSPTLSSKDSPKDLLTEAIGTRGAPRDLALWTSEIDALREIVRQLSAENSRLRGEKMLIQMKSLKPLKRLARRSASTLGGLTEAESDNKQTPGKSCSIQKVNRQLAELQQKLYVALSYPKVVLLPQVHGKGEYVTPPPASDENSGQTLSDTIPPSASNQLIRQATYLVKLREEFEQLQASAKEAMKEDYPQAFVNADFTSFPSSRIQTILNSTSPAPNDRLVSRLIFPGATGQSVETLRIAMPSTQIKALKSHLLSLS
ncbi:hypothetical protein EG68_03150 [Paragonimus skrjabini miyazakii]|uniref:Dynactin subunit 1 n=1 Tax=Paragonimus skrjabini miyazakii TaxID=59628 RepID=A0A8S9YWK9_9TREM|nr:hypothetical protein EG68_03150 [Paragonimus skrjabini miyazakii]